MLYLTVIMIISNGGGHSSGGTGSTRVTVMMGKTIRAVPMTSGISEKKALVV